jgi:hypothetical protein
LVSPDYDDWGIAPDIERLFGRERGAREIEDLPKVKMWVV